MEPFESIDEVRANDRHTQKDVERLRALTVVHPECAELWDVLGDTMQLCEDREYSIEEVLECYLRSIHCDPTYSPAHVSLAYAYDTYRDDFARAELHFRLAIALGAGDSARVGLARVLAQMGRSDEAIEELNACDEQEHDDVASLRREIREGLWSRRGA